MKSVDGIEVKDVPDGTYCRDLSTGKIYVKQTLVDINHPDKEEIVMIEIGEAKA